MKQKYCDVFHSCTVIYINVYTSLIQLHNHSAISYPIQLDIIIHVPHNLSLILINCRAMRSDTSSSADSHPHLLSDHVASPVPQGFLFTRKDVELLSEYLDDFQDSDAEVWAKIIENAMADLAVDQPDEEPFNKAEVSKVIPIYLAPYTMRSYQFIEN